MMIEDGKGTGLRAQVNEEHKLEVRAVVVSDLEYKNEENELVWSLPVETVAINAGQYFFYFQNTGTQPLAVALARLNASAAGLLKMVKVTGTAGGGTAVTPLNNNLGSAKTPTSIVYRATAATGITGLTSVGTLYNWYMQTNVPMRDELIPRLYLSPGSAVAFSHSVNANIDGSLTIYEE